MSKRAGLQKPVKLDFSDTVAAPTASVGATIKRRRGGAAPLGWLCTVCNTANVGGEKCGNQRCCLLRSVSGVDLDDSSDVAALSTSSDPPSSKKQKPSIASKPSVAAPAAAAAAPSPAKAVKFQTAVCVNRGARTLEPAAQSLTCPLTRERPLLPRNTEAGAGREGLGEHHARRLGSVAGRAQQACQRDRS